MKKLGAVLALVLAASRGGTTTWVVSPQGPFTSLSEAIQKAQPGDTLRVQGGTYKGPIIVSKTLTLIGEGAPLIEGEGKGSVVKLQAPGIRFQGFRIRGSGAHLSEENSGIELLAPDIVVENNHLEDVLFGIYLRKAHRSKILNNRIEGKSLPLPLRGDLIRLWYSDDVLIQGNILKRGRDVVLWFSNRLKVQGNQISGGRYGLHFMYCDDAEIRENILSHNSVGAFLMYSRRLRFRWNFVAYNRGGSGFGIGLKDLDDGLLENNLIVDNRVGVYVDNSPREITSRCVYRNNVLAFNDFGVVLLPSVRRNLFEGNSFIENEEQVAIQGGGSLHAVRWRGNHWSDYVGYDLDGDGTGDLPYKSQRFFENLTDQHPQLRLFLYSPVVQALDFAARAIPLVQPRPKLVDSLPQITAQIPDGIPAPPRHKRPAMSLASIGLMLLALGVSLLAKFPPSSSERENKQEVYTSLKAPVIEVRDLTKRFGPLVAVQGVSFQVRPGEAIALWGPNGAGKTTILRCMLGLLSYEGEVRVGGKDTRRQGREVRKQIGFVPQELGLYGDFTVEEILQFFARLREVSIQRVHLLLETLDLGEVRELQVRALSGGMRQRVALTIALLSDPPILLLDEPTANLDLASRSAFLHMLGRFKEEGKTLVFTSHRFEEVRALADRVIALESGRVVAQGQPEEVAEQLGWKTRLRIFPDRPEDIDRAVALLKKQGFEVSQNGAGILVEVPFYRKGRPLEVLLQEGIPVRDFEIERGGEEVEEV